MILTSRNILISLLLLLAASLSGWTIFLSGKSQKSVIDTRPNLPDAIMEEVETVVMSKVGTPILKVESSKLIHYAENDTTELIKPHLVIFRESPQPWHINANHGKAVKGVSEITFWEDVVIHHLADNDNPVTTMRTSILTVLPNEQIAKTDVAVDVLQPYTSAHGIGMLANWRDGTVKLLSQAREEYVPNS